MRTKFAGRPASRAIICRETYNAHDRAVNDSKIPSSPQKPPHPANSRVCFCVVSTWNELEARVGIEPTHKGFADLSLTTWVPRLTPHRLPRGAGHTLLNSWSLPQEEGVWSGRPGSNRRHLPWQGSTLPLSYSRPAMTEYNGVATDLQSGRAGWETLTQLVIRPGEVTCPGP